MHQRIKIGNMQTAHAIVEANLRVTEVIRCAKDVPGPVPESYRKLLAAIDAAAMWRDAVKRCQARDRLIEASA